MIPWRGKKLTEYITEKYQLNSSFIHITNVDAEYTPYNTKPNLVIKSYVRSSEGLMAKQNKQADKRGN